MSCEKHLKTKSVTALTLKIRGGVRTGLLRQESRERCAYPMGEERNIGCEPRSDIVCLEGNGARPSHRGGGYSMSGTMFTLNQTEVHAVAYALEHHPNDSRLKISEDGICQTLNSRMGTGGGNVPLVMEIKDDKDIPQKRSSDA